MTDTAETTPSRGALRFNALEIAREYGVLIIIAVLMISLTLLSDSFLTPRNLLNILNQSTPLFIIACALTLVIIGGGFDLSTGAIFGVASVSAGWLAINVDPIFAIFAAR
jgi:ribose transport system permease protein